MSATSEGNASAVARQVAVGRFKPTLSPSLRMAVMSELDSAAGLEGWSISTRWIVLIAPAVHTAGSPHRFPPRVWGQSAHQGNVRYRVDASGTHARARSRRGGRARRRDPGLTGASR
jgi:hypothetical protein